MSDRIKKGMSHEEFSDAYDQRVDELKELNKKQLIVLIMTSEFEVRMLKDILDDNLEYMEKQTRRTRNFVIVMLILWSIMLILASLRLFYG